MATIKMVVVIAILVVILNLISLLASSSLNGVRGGSSQQLEKIAAFECGLEPFGNSRVKFEAFMGKVSIGSISSVDSFPSSAPLVGGSPWIALLH